MSPGSSELSSDARKQLLYAVRRVLRPIVRLVIRVGMPFNEFADIARSAYIESAIRDHPSGVCPTRDRIAFVTGLSRQQVDYYTEGGRALPVARPTLARLVTEVLHKWHTDPNYVGPYGIPLELEFDTPRARSIQSLVAKIDPTASAGKVLEELIRAGSVAYSGEKRYRAIRRWLICPEALSPLSIESFGDTLTHLAHTIEYNFSLMDPESKRLERRVFADRGLPRKFLPSFEAYARERGNMFLLAMDDWIARSITPNAKESDQIVDIGVNVFFYVEPPSEEQALSTMVQLPRDIGTFERQLSQDVNDFK